MTQDYCTFCSREAFCLRLAQYRDIRSTLLPDIGTRLFPVFRVVLINRDRVRCLDCPVLLGLCRSLSSLGHRSYPYWIFLCPGNRRIHPTHPHDARLGRFR